MVNRTPIRNRPEIQLEMIAKNNFRNGRRWNGFRRALRAKPISPVDLGKPDNEAQVFRLTLNTFRLPSAS
jgi:hypothetical protein